MASAAADTFAASSAPIAVYEVYPPFIITARKCELVSPHILSLGVFSRSKYTQCFILGHVNIHAGVLRSLIPAMMDQTKFDSETLPAGIREILSTHPLNFPMGGQYWKRYCEISQMSGVDACAEILEYQSSHDYKRINAGVINAFALSFGSNHMVWNLSDRNN